MIDDLPAIKLVDGKPVLRVIEDLHYQNQLSETALRTKGWTIGILLVLNLIQLLLLLRGWTC